MTHFVSFTNARYTNLQTLVQTDYAHLLRSFDTERNEHVLLQVFRTSNEAEQSYILTEAAALAKLASPHIASLYDVNITANNEPYIAFENLQHIPLDTVPHTRFANAQFIVQMAASLLTALAPLHAQMRALLCLSPTSVRLADEDSPVARIALDSWFPLAGDIIARAVYGEHNQYAAPELVLQRTADARADLYSIGITLYEVITGQSFNEVAVIESSGMLSHLVLKSLRQHAPALPDALVQWIYALLERDRSMRFFSVREALEYLAAHGLLPSEMLGGLEPSPVNLAPVSIIGLETAFAAVVNVQSPFVESPVLEISGEPGLGKTMLLRSLMQSRMHSTTLLRHKVAYFAAQASHSLPREIQAALEKQEPTLFLVDDAEQMPEDVRLAAKALLAQEDATLAGVRLVATHRSQLARLAAKPTMLTLSNFAPSHVPMFCAEILGRCAFTPEFHRQLYAQTKGHPLALALTVRSMVKNGVITRRNRIWTHDASVEYLAAQVPPSLSALMLKEMRALSEESLTMLAAVHSALNVCEALHLPVSLHLLAEMLDSSTQSALRRLLVLTFEGFVYLHNSAVEWAHETFRETASAAVDEGELLRFQGIAEELVRSRHAALFPAKTPPETAPLLEFKPEIPQEPQHKTLAQSIEPNANDEILEARHVSPASAPVREKQIASSEANTHPISIHAVLANMPDAPTSVSEPLPSLAPSEGTFSLSSSILLQGISDAAHLLRKSVETAAAHDVPCLIESVYGAYREDVAAIIHSASQRRERPFHALSCADFEAHELETYLFGTSTEAGLIATSEGGTVFLDEIVYASASVQARLARLIQSHRKQGKVQVPRPQTTVSADVRLIVGYTIADGARADAAMRTGTITNELFFAVSTMRILLPALAERREDVQSLAKMYARTIADEYGVSMDTSLVPPAFWAKFSTKSWIADMTELEANMRSFVLQFDPAHRETSLFALESTLFGETKRQPIPLSPATAAIPLPSLPDDDSLLSIDDAQKEHILRALEMTSGNKTKAAEMLKIKRTTLLARMKKFGLMP
ncbi:MAG: sigma 54-interacting transcriptional regulator [Candidatus Kapaibacteriota bacterium]